MPAKRVEFLKMGISEILKSEQENTSVILHNEGLFWRAYEYSAYLFIKHFMQYSITKKFYKNVQKEVVYMGFPQNSFAGVERICKEQKLTLQKNGKVVIISGFSAFNIADYEAWKNSVHQVSAQKQLPNSTIMEKIRSFPVISKSPVECQLFLIEIQRDINGQLH